MKTAERAEKAKVAAIQKGLMAWYRAGARELPWRRTREPYAIWVSEIMLQQTQVVKVISYYQEFLKRFPDVRALAGATLDAVLKAWEGMGYYARARNLHKAAVRIVAEYGGELPRDVEQLSKLPGVGRYTAGAVASIAFGLDEPVLDGNVIRVLCRLYRVQGRPSEAGVRESLWGLARALVPAGEAGDFNQAMMELGAMVCRPRGPKCGECPAAEQCEARRRGEQEGLPMRDAGKAVPHYVVAAGVVRKAGKVLIGRRKAEGLLGGLWEFPGGKRQAGEALDETVRREVREEAGVAVEVVRPMVVVKHAYTHFRITLHAYECRYVSGRARAMGCDACRWVRPEELKEYAFPKANHAILEAIERQKEEGAKVQRHKVRSKKSKS